MQQPRALPECGMLVTAACIGQAHAAAELVDAVIHCRFEETDAHMDEVVKMTLIEVRGGREAG